MERLHPHMTLDRIVLLVTVVALAGAITFVEAALPPMAQWRQFLYASTPPLALPIKTPQAAATPSPSATPTATSAPVVVPTTPSATPAPQGPTATTVSFVHFRSGKTTSSPIIADLDGGTTVELRQDADSTWQGVRYNGQNGYIYKAYLQY